MNEAAQSPLPIVTEVLRLPEVVRGEPEIVAGEAGLDRSIRWAHVVAGPGAAALLEGDELVLTTGAGWPRSVEQLETLSNALVARASAIVLELGSALRNAPDPLVRACDKAQVPLILLHREIRFVQVTQRVHQRILAAHTEALEAREQVHAMLTELGLNRSPVDYVIERLAETLEATVILEDSAHRVVAFAARGDDPTDALTPWGHEGDPILPRGSARVSVEARGRRWGHLTALPGPSHPAGRRTVLELGAFALALGRLADTDEDQWLQLSSKRVFELLLSGRYRNDTELETQLAAAGLPVAGRTLIPATLRGIGEFGGHVSLEHATLETALRRAVAPHGRLLIAEEAHSLLAIVSVPPNTPALGVRLSRELDMLVPDSTPAAWRAHLALGVPASRLSQLVASLEQLRAAGATESPARIGRLLVQEAARRPLAHLVRTLSSTPEMQQFSLEMLSPLIEHDAVTGSGHPRDLQRVLAAYLQHPTNRSLAARQANLSRSVFYQRLELIEDLLAADLSDGETLAALSVAMLARP